MRSSLSRILVFTTLALLNTAAALAQKTINVPADQPTIQAGINAANTGDTVLVAPGTYYENIDFLGKAITVISANGAATTTIDGRHRTSTVVFQNGEVRSSILNGFTILNGQSPGLSTISGGAPGAGIAALQTAPSILNNIVKSSYCAGILSYYAAPLVQGNVISETDDTQNSCQFGNNAPLLLVGVTAPTLRSVYTTTVIGNQVINNNSGGLATTAQSYAAGLGIEAQTAIVENNIIRDNAQALDGGGLRIDSPLQSYGTTVVSGNLVVHNTTGCGPAGMNLTFNSPSTIGAPTLYIVNNTIADNIAGTSCDGDLNTNNVLHTASQVSTYYDTNQVVFANNILSASSNLATMDCFNASLNNVIYGAQGLLVFDHNNIYNGASNGVAVGTGCSLQDFSYGNTYVDPQFRFAANEDYHLASSSPLIDAGNNSAGPLLAVDLDGSPRIAATLNPLRPVIDLGAYETAGTANLTATQTSLVPNAYLYAGAAQGVLTITVTGINGTPATGVIRVEQDSVNIGSAVLNTHGIATLTDGPLVPGIHRLVAYYAGASSFDASQSVEVVIVVQKYQPVITLTSSPNPSFTHQAVQFTATINSPDSAVLSPILFRDFYATTGDTVSTDATGKAVDLHTYDIAGTYYYDAIYNGDTTHFGASAQVTQRVLDPYATTLVLSSSANPSIVNTTVTFTATLSSVNGMPPTGTVNFTYGATSLGSQTLTAQGAGSTATISTASLPLGFDTITATLVPTGTFLASAGNLLQDLLPGYATSTTLTSSINPSASNQAVTFTAHVASQTPSTSGTPTGSITFTDGANTLATQPLDTNSNATFSIATLTVGAHTITATYTPTGSFAASAATLTQTVNGLAATATLTAAPVTSTYGTPVTLTATVTAATPGPQIPTGIVTFCYVTTVLGQPTCTGTVIASVPITAGLAALTYPNFPAGTSNLGCIYKGDATFNGVSCNTVSITVTAAPSSLSLTASTSAASALTPITFSAQLSSASTPVPLESIRFTADGAALNTATTASPSGIASLTFASLALGRHTILALFDGDNLHAPATSAPLIVTITANPTTMTLIAAPNPGYQGTPITITTTTTVAAATAPAGVHPYGTVTVLDGTTSLATLTITAAQASASASFTVSSLATGSHTLTAAFTPLDASFLPTASAAFTLVILPQSFTLSTDPPTITVQTEHHRALAVSLTSTGPLTGRFSLTCGPLPEAASCRWGLTTLNLPPSGTVSTSLTLETDVVPNFKSSLDAPLPRKGVSTPIVLALLFPLAIFTARRRRPLRSLLPLCLLGAITLSLTACSSKYPDHTPPGIYSISITATPLDSSTTPPQTIQLTMTVTP